MSGQRSTGWGADPEPYDPHADEERKEERRRKASSGSRGPSHVTLVFALLVELFGFYVMGQRGEILRAAWEVRKTVAQMEEAMGRIPEIPGIPRESLGGPEMLGDSLAPMYWCGGLGMAAGILFFVIGVLVLLRLELASRPGAPGLLLAAVLFVAAKVVDTWIGFRAVEMWEQSQSAMARVVGDERVQQMMAQASQDANADVPTRGDFVVSALIWVIPVLVVSLWGARHLMSPEVSARLGRWGD
jgi:hypothetical protein